MSHFRCTLKSLLTHMMPLEDASPEIVARVEEIRHRLGGIVLLDDASSLAAADEVFAQMQRNQQGKLQQYMQKTLAMLRGTVRNVHE